MEHREDGKSSRMELCSGACVRGRWEQTEQGEQRRKEQITEEQRRSLTDRAGTRAERSDRLLRNLTRNILHLHCTKEKPGEMPSPMDKEGKQVQEDSK